MNILFKGKYEDVKSSFRKEERREIFLEHGDKR